MKKYIWSGLMIAIIFVTTSFIKIPIPALGSYHAGDGFVLLSGMILGGGMGFISAALGSALSDIAGGYAIWAPATFIIKGSMALLVSLFAKGKHKGVLLGFILAEILMVLAYLCYEGFFLLGNWQAALPGLSGNLVQGAVGVLVASLLYFAISRTTGWKDMEP